ncbi:MAG: DUF3344 domain-containing protein [Polyangiaceae bacterium]|nr:DUF3344 domain-containing protein [Polyangiaceae bacterium]
MFLRSTSILGFGLASLLGAWSALGAPPKLRHQADLQGDVVVLGSTLALDCSSEVPAPPANTTTACSGQDNVLDTAPDLYWRDTAANTSISASQARTSATLVLPAGAKVTYARLYWAALKTGQEPDKSVTLDFAGGPAQSVAADDSWSLSYGFASHPDRYYYQSTANVTSYVAQWGAGDFRVTGVDSLPLAGVSVDRAFSAWTLVVFYEKAGDELRNLALFDGLTNVDPGLAQGSAEVTLSGILVPPGFSAKMSAFTYEGDFVYKGDFFTFNGQKLANAENPVDNFFNSSRSYLGQAVSGASDVPKLSGKPGTMSGYDLDTADVTSLVKAGDTSAKVGAASDLDIFLLGGFVTSVTNKAPDYLGFEKTAVDLDGGSLLPGDEVEYVLSATNSGNDASVSTVVLDQLDPGLDFVPGSLQIVSGGAIGPKTDAIDGDEGSYDATTRTVRFHVGSGATASSGGTVAVGQTVTVKFRVKVLAQSGDIPNQGEIQGLGESGTPKKTWLTDADPLTPGDQPTIVTIEECGSNADCPANKPFCDLQTKTCQPCSNDSHCTDPNLPACQPNGSCGECSSTNKTQCTGATPACNTTTGECAPCTPEDATLCVGDPSGPVCQVGSPNFCGCESDSDCGNTKSGRVCDVGSTDKCIDGCRGTDGNGCPDGLVCTSTDGTIGSCVPEGDGNGNDKPTGAADSGDDGSCACRTTGGSGGTGGALLALLGAAALRLRRRRAARG